MKNVRGIVDYDLYLRITDGVYMVQDGKRSASEGVAVQEGACVGG